MELYEYARPGLFAGKKILYVHGFASSGASGTVGRLRLLLPQATVIAPDLPVDPHEAISLLKDLCARENPDLIVGTSMGGMYTEQLTGYDRICVNPALHLADTILKNNGLGKQEFHNVRQDGQTSFMVTKALLEDYRAVSDNRFSVVEPDRVYGLFGTRDTMVNCFDEFAAHYPQSIHFDGEHQLNDHTFLWTLLPVMQWIDDRQEGRAKRTLMVEMDDVLRDTRNDLPVGEAFKVFHHLSELYDAYIVCREDPNKPERWGENLEWASAHIGVPAWNRVLVGNHPELLMG
ncbi:MAG: esterase, partial [Bacteroidales bacterium]|nr:esterase [Bacteroidales bacterium]